jgi:glycosyltransferase involved in cell wall biosynthesis
MNPLRVVLIAPSPAIVGGQSVQAARLLDQLRRQPGLDISLYPINPLLPSPVRVLQKFKYVRTLAAELAYASGLFRRTRHCDVVHVFSAGYWSFLLVFPPVAIVSKLFGKPLILHYHDGRAADHFRHFPRSVQWARKADGIVVPSGFLVEVFKKFDLAARAIPNTVETAQFSYRQRSILQPRFLHNRGLERHYNVPCSIRAFSIVQQRYPDASLVIAHDGPMRHDLEMMVAGMGLRNITFAGGVSQERMRALYDEADIYLMSPDIDNMPLSILECFASGLPVVSTAVGGIRFVIENERTGLLVSRNDHKALAAAALRYLNEPNLVDRVTRNGLKECDRYRAETIAGEWSRLYREVSSREPV